MAKVVKTNKLPVMTDLTKGKLIGLDKNGNDVQFPLELLAGDNLGDAGLNTPAPAALLNQYYNIGNLYGTFVNFIGQNGQSITRVAPGANKAYTSGRLTYNGTYWVLSPDLPVDIPQQNLANYPTNSAMSAAINEATVVKSNPTPIAGSLGTVPPQTTGGITAGLGSARMHKDAFLYDGVINKISQNVTQAGNVDFVIGPKTGENADGSPIVTPRVKFSYVYSGTGVQDIGQDTLLSDGKKLADYPFFAGECFIWYGKALTTPGAVNGARFYVQVGNTGEQLSYSYDGDPAVGAPTSFKHTALINIGTGISVTYQSVSTTPAVELLKKNGIDIADLQKLSNVSFDQIADSVGQYPATSGGSAQTQNHIDIHLRPVPYDGIVDFVSMGMVGSGSVRVFVLRPQSDGLLKCIKVYTLSSFPGGVSTTRNVESYNIQVLKGDYVGISGIGGTYRVSTGTVYNASKHYSGLMMADDTVSFVNSTNIINGFGYHIKRAVKTETVKALSYFTDKTYQLGRGADYNPNGALAATVNRIRFDNMPVPRDGVLSSLQLSFSKIGTFRIARVGLVVDPTNSNAYLGTYVAFYDFEITQSGDQVLTPNILLNAGEYWGMGAPTGGAEFATTVVATGTGSLIHTSASGLVGGTYPVTKTSSIVEYKATITEQNPTVKEQTQKNADSIWAMQQQISMLQSLTPTQYQKALAFGTDIINRCVNLTDVDELMTHSSLTYIDDTTSGYIHGGICYMVYLSNKVNTTEAQDDPNITLNLRWWPVNDRAKMSVIEVAKINTDYGNGVILSKAPYDGNILFTGNEIRIFFRAFIGGTDNTKIYNAYRVFNKVTKQMVGGIVICKLNSSGTDFSYPNFRSYLTSKNAAYSTINGTTGFSFSGRIRKRGNTWYTFMYGASGGGACWLSSTDAGTTWIAGGVPFNPDLTDANQIWGEGDWDFVGDTNNIYALFRNTKTTGRIWEAYSEDLGQTWSKPVNIANSYDGRPGVQYWQGYILRWFVTTDRMPSAWGDPNRTTTNVHAGTDYKTMASDKLLMVLRLETGSHYHTIINYKGSLYVTYSTDRRKLDIEQIRSNIEFSSIPWLTPYL